MAYQRVLGWLRVENTFVNLQKGFALQTHTAHLLPKALGSQSYKISFII